MAEVALSARLGLPATQRYCDTPDVRYMPPGRAYRCKHALLLHSSDDAAVLTVLVRVTGHGLHGSLLQTQNVLIVLSKYFTVLILFQLLEAHHGPTVLLCVQRRNKCQPGYTSSEN